MKFLLALDRELRRSAFAELLNSWMGPKCEIEMAEDLDELMQKSVVWKPDFIMLDWRFEQGDGLAVIRGLRWMPLKKQPLLVFYCPVFLSQHYIHLVPASPVRLIYMPEGLFYLPEVIETLYPPKPIQKKPRQTYFTIIDSKGYVSAPWVPDRERMNRVFGMELDDWLFEEPINEDPDRRGTAHWR